jgi:5S rRNA maturation endonuclease (ribonuclease M5)
MISNKKYNLIKIKETVFEDLEKLLDSFDINYHISNDNYHCTCPIHQDSDNKTACYFSNKTKSWKCWTRGCHEVYGKDIIGFVRGIISSRNGEEASFQKAIKYIISLYDIKDYRINAQKQTDNDEDKENINDIIKIFKKKPEHYDAKKIQEIKLSQYSKYFESRGFLKSTLEYFEVGDCEDIESPMKNRAVIPIHDKNNFLVGYIGRSIKSYITPKFLFSKGLKKTDHLYNLNRSKDMLLERPALVLLEGQGDVWRMHEAGIKNCVGLFGKEISENQKNLLLEFGITTIILLLDNDQPGREAKFQIQRQLDRLFNIKFPSFSKKDIGEMSVEQIKKDILPQIKGYY